MKTQQGHPSYGWMADKSPNKLFYNMFSSNMQVTYRITSRSIFVQKHGSWFSNDVGSTTSSSWNSSSDSMASSVTSSARTASSAPAVVSQEAWRHEGVWPWKCYNVIPLESFSWVSQRNANSTKKSFDTIFSRGVWSPCNFCKNADKSTQSPGFSLDDTT